MRRRNPDTPASRRTEIVGMLRAMPTRWRRAYNTARRTLADNGGPVLPDVPTPEQAMLILGNTAGGNRDIDQPTGDQPVPQAVRDEAMHGLRLSYKNDYPGWEFFGIARAIQLVLVPGVPMRTRQRMKRYLDAHAKDKLAPHFGDEEKPSKGYMAWLNWAGDSGAAWNADVPRATYSARTRGERDNSFRRQNPLFARHRDSTQYIPVRAGRLAEMQRIHGEHNIVSFGTPGAFWTPERVEDFLNRNPDLRGKRFPTRGEAVVAVSDALYRMVLAGQIPDLPHSRRTAADDHARAAHQLATSVPLLQDLGHNTELSADRQRMRPYRVGLLTVPHDERMWERGNIRHARPYAKDFGDEGFPPWVLRYMVRPDARRVRQGDIVYFLSGSVSEEGTLAQYYPHTVLRVRADAEHSDENVLAFKYTIRPADTRSSLRQGTNYANGEWDIEVNEWDVLRQDEMPPNGDYVRPELTMPGSAAQAGEALTAAAVAATASAAQAGEALTAAAVAAPTSDTASSTATKVRRPKAKVIAVMSPFGVSYAYVVLFDPAVLVRGELSEDDVLGFATASYSNTSNDARISVAASEPGYAYLLYATLAKHLASSFASAVLRGSYQQTEYAKRFWARQPNGAIAGMSPDDFKRTFGMTYASIVAAGEELTRRLAVALGARENDARERLRSLGSQYFDDYYGVSSKASRRLGPDKLRRPASPRETVEAVRKASARKLASRDLALVVSQDEFFGGIKGYLFTVPRGKSTLTPANLLAVWDIRRPSQPGARVGEFADDLYGPLARSKRTAEGEAVMQVLREYNTDAETPHTRREAKRWAARGEALKVALANAGQTDLQAYLEYLDKAASNYGERARRIESEGKRKLNPRRDKLAVRIFMPV